MSRQKKSTYLQHPLHAHFPLSQGQFLSSPPQLQVVLLVPATFSVFAFGHESQAHWPGAQPQTLVSPPHWHVVLSVPDTFFTSDFPQPEQAHSPGAQGQASDDEPHLQVVFFSVPSTVSGVIVSFFFRSARRRASVWISTT